MSAQGGFSATIIGVERVEANFRMHWPAEARRRIADTVKALGFELETRVKTDKLNGGVLKRQSGRLSRSINTRFTETAMEFTSTTGTSLSYGRIWEVTGSREFTIVPRKKKALFWPGAAHPVRSVTHPAQAPRPFLKPTLAEMRGTIRASLEAAMQGLAKS